MTILLKHKYVPAIVLEHNTRWIGKHLDCRDARFRFQRVFVKILLVIQLHFGDLLCGRIWDNN